MTRTLTSYPVSVRPAKPVAAGVLLAAATDSYALHCRSRNLSPETVAIYVYELGQLGRYLRSKGMPEDVGLIRREHLEQYLIDRMDIGRKPASVSMSFRSMRTFFKWLVSEDEIASSPMDRMRAPVVPVDPPAIVRKDEMDALLATCKGRTFDDRRDRALLLFMFDTGVRRGELVNMNLDDVDLRLRVARVKGKARIFRTVAFGDDVAEALDRYLRMRKGHAQADTVDEAGRPFFIGRKGRFGGSGILIMMKRRGGQAGVDLHPHTMRHSWAHAMLSSGASEGDVMALGGWRSREMLDRYGSVARTERAIEAHRRLSPADKLRRK